MIETESSQCLVGAQNEFLYRGVNKQLDSDNCGEILAAGTIKDVVVRLDGRFKCDGSIVLGPAETNTAHAHQLETALYDGCGISTSRSEQLAISFATFKGNLEGYIYVIDESRLADACVNAYEFAEPRYPEEFEVTLIPPDGRVLPSSVIVGKYEVSKEGVRKVDLFNRAPGDLP